MKIHEYNEMMAYLTRPAPKKTYGYDESVVSAEKIRKSKEEHERLSNILDEFDVRDREPNAYGGIAGTLRLNRTGTPRTKNAEGGRVKMSKGGLPNILKL